LQLGELKRREFITLLGGATVLPRAAHAQQPKGAVGRLGLLTVASGVSPIEAALVQGLRDLGYVDGQNLIIEYRAASGKEDQLPRLAAELIAAKVDVLFTSGSQATDAARKLTTNIPIVMVSSNPVGLGFVESLARPGGNITGLSILGPEISGKRLELLKEMIPRLSTVAVFWNSNDPAARFSLQETLSAANVLKIRLIIQETPDVGAFSDAFRAAITEGAAAVILLPAPLMSRNAEPIASLAIQHRLPTLFYSGEAARAGGLMSYGANLSAVSRRGAYFIDRILKGAKPAELPVEQPTKFDLIINLKTARALGLTVPDKLLALADEVIE
jgi:putative ABC transport system substrate-binding protein